MSIFQYSLRQFNLDLCVLSDHADSGTVVQAKAPFRYFEQVFKVIGILFILLFALAAISVAIYRLQRAQSDVRADRAVAPPTSGGLFDDYGHDAQIVEGEGAESRRARLLER